MLSADQPAPDVARAHRAVEPLHNHVYFSPEQDEYLTAVGLRPGRMCYFAGRAAAMGAVGPGTVVATFANFAPAIVARHVPRAWTLASPEQVLAARLDGARASLTRLLGSADAATAPEVTELAGLLREACTALTPEGRPLYAAHADQPWPEEPVLSLWHGATLLREHRGDGHVACLLQAGLTGLESLVTHTLTGRGFTEAAAKATRGWSDEEWTAAADRLTARGLVADGALTEAGIALRAEVEAGTDELSAAPWVHLGAERTARVVELGRALSARLVANGAYPAGVFAAR
ncbi:SCO6745 family protein [Geodermatophilus sp. URMC 61]|uniref:SCO6745 family protein n=1 Tax=Geodermatophilus sp. URMC 61 TaxID=3423411 RepID=UPI00406C9778